MSLNTNNKIVQIADSVHKYISIPDKFYLKLIDTTEFQRLRRLGQLGGVPISYPSATHSRFAHSLGAFHIANRMITSLKNKHPDVVSEEDVDYVRIASLIHDIGHGPFSHMFEDIFTKFCKNEKNVKKFKPFQKHENITEQIVLSDESEVGKILNDKGFNKRKIAHLIIGKEIEGKPFLNQIIASQLDGDSIDYLMRDSLETGVSYGLYNIDRLIAMLNISKDGNIIVKEKGLQSVEQIVVARYMQFARVYFHKTVRCWEFMVKTFIYELIRSKEKGTDIALLPFLENFIDNPYWKTMLPLTDDTIYTQIQLSALKEEKNKVLEDLAKRLLRRKLFKSIPITEETANKLLKNREVIDKIIEKFNYPKEFWGIDSFYSRYYTPYEEKNRNAILVKMKNGSVKQLSEVSEVVQSLSKPKHNSLLICPEECKNEIIKKEIIEIFE
ncbi:MAG: HD domain-containing protein [Candidatus Heimdallarchaeaceae archaeon]